MEAKFNALENTTCSEFKAAVHKICKEVTPTMLENVYSPITMRMRLVIAKAVGRLTTRCSLMEHIFTILKERSGCTDYSIDKLLRH